MVDAPGGHTLVYIDPAFPDRPLLLHARGRGASLPATPVLFVHHGVGRNGRDYRDYWLQLVDEAGILAIAIEFPEASFPEYLWYHFGNLHDEDGTREPARSNGPMASTSGCSRHCSDRASRTRQRYGLFGHSAGGQFVHRMLSFGFREHVAVAVSANAGTYAMPDLDVAWPFGLGETELDADDAAAAAGIPASR